MKKSPFCWAIWKKGGTVVFRVNDRVVMHATVNAGVRFLSIQHIASLSSIDSLLAILQCMET